MIIGLTGTLGAGKGAVVEYLVDKKGFKHYSAREFFKKEVLKRELPVNRDTITAVANELTKKHSPRHVAEELYKEAARVGGHAVIESIRRPSEVEFLKEQGDFILCAVDADPKIRFNRIQERGSETDNVDFETFLAHEAREMNAQNPHEQNISACVNCADHVFLNNGDFNALHSQIEEALFKYLKE